ncbi:MAG TPA: Gfo/Idh/MocA family oxidoreductase [Phycisphaerae bacterium]|jgi:glucose-fructose oxidoreductase|nr:Gfo/Idh/MocA family oxidoreductase [Phycisphaerae bacterium]HOB75222.1 Gfo/Idh/MocA family oxidoreductase [Phycisphaerae bacterium]HOJ54703.1 Gfo/Idh/MocA family oxidoreductase [Phycisphaerae bacterium]HOL25947.1 Gfo/Idh/MocA family oxidoreductase [Phycisphaerae bacterium]HPP19481.1 Gfo/Idh/MocA family oxidoreductase [Phycisphaerae bacterium]
MCFLEEDVSKSSKTRKIRYALVGLGHIAQTAVLPAFLNARKNSTLTALVSGDPAKLKKLGRKYKVERLYSYEQYDECLRSGEIDAVFITLPNDMHAEYSIRAARAGIHVLCEKPMAVTSDQCRQMIQACREGNVKLMIAYRLHFEPANLQAIEIAQSGKLGELRLFNSVFSFQVGDPDNIRVQRERGGGTIYDIGVYCINAARYLFQDEPYEVFAFSANPGDERFREVDEMTGAMLRFPRERLATFVTSFGASAVSAYRIVGTKGDLRLEPAYDYQYPLVQYLTVNQRTRQKSFKQRDQFAAELAYFSDCIRTDRDPEPSGEEGWADVRVIEAIYRSAQTGQPVRLEPFEKQERPTAGQKITAGGRSRPRAVVNVKSPKKE